MLDIYCIAQILIYRSSHRITEPHLIASKLYLFNHIPNLYPLLNVICDGMTPVNGPDILMHMRRLATGQLEIFLSKFYPFLCIDRNIMVCQRMVYGYFSLCGSFSATMFFYAILLALFMLNGKSFLPMILEPALAIAIALFISIYDFKLFKFLRISISIREWWNNQRMQLIQYLSPLLLATFDVLMKLLRVQKQFSW